MRLVLFFLFVGVTMRAYGESQTVRDLENALRAAEQELQTSGKAQDFDRAYFPITESLAAKDPGVRARP